MTANIFCATVTFVVLVVASGQLFDWEQYNDYDAVLPEGVKVFKTKVEKWPALKAFLVTADVRKYKVPRGWDLQTALSANATTHLSTVQEFSRDFDAIVATNGGFFGTSEGIGLSYSLAAMESKLLSPNMQSLSRSGQLYYPTRCAFGINKKSSFDAYWVYESDSGGIWAYDKPSPNIQSSSPQEVPSDKFPTAAIDWDIVSGVGGGPMLVFRSVDVSLESYDAEVMWGSGVPALVAAARTAIGIGTPLNLNMTSPQLLWMVVDGVDDITGVTIPDIASEFIELGAESACNLDGGGSTQFIVNQTLVNSPNGAAYQRALAAGVLMFKL